MQPVNLVKFVVRAEKNGLKPLTPLRYNLADSNKPIKRSNVYSSVVTVGPFQFCALSPAERSLSKHNGRCYQLTVCTFVLFLLYSSNFSSSFKSKKNYRTSQRPLFPVPGIKQPDLYACY